MQCKKYTLMFPSVRIARPPRWCHTLASHQQFLRPVHQMQLALRLDVKSTERLMQCRRPPRVLKSMA